MAIDLEELSLVVILQYLNFTDFTDIIQIYPLHRRYPGLKTFNCQLLLNVNIQSIELYTYRYKHMQLLVSLGSML
jgi:hypothetical protein